MGEEVLYVRLDGCAINRLITAAKRFHKSVNVARGLGMGAFMWKEGQNRDKIGKTLAKMEGQLLL